VISAVTAIFGFSVGLVASTTGIGGGVMLVPFLHLCCGVPIQHAAALSLAVIAAGAAGSTWRYRKQKRIAWKTGAGLVAVMLPGTLLGARVVNSLPTSVLQSALAAVLLAAGVRILARTFHKDAERHGDEKGRPRWFSYPAAAGAGVASAALGIGGGVIMVPVLLACRYGMRIAAATSAFMILLNSSFGTASHVWFGNFRLAPLAWYHYAPLVAGMVCGTQFGAHFMHRARVRFLRLLFCAALAVAVVRLAARALL